MNDGLDWVTWEQAIDAGIDQEYLSADMFDRIGHDGQSCGYFPTICELVEQAMEEERFYENTP